MVGGDRTVPPSPGAAVFSDSFTEKFAFRPCVIACKVSPRPVQAFRFVPRGVSPQVASRDIDA